MEVWHWADVKVNMAATSYWYARPGAKDGFDAIDPAVAHRHAPAAARAQTRQGRARRRKLEILSVTGGNVTTQQSATWAWSGEQQLWWMDGAPAMCSPRL